MKLIFAGTPHFALPSLQKLYDLGYEITVLTQPDKPQGRKGILTPSPVKTLALSLGLDVLQPSKLKEDFSALKKVGAPCMVTCAYGQILTQEILDLFPLGVWNIHASLLPSYRGAAPIARVIMEGEKSTGVTIMKTEEGLDTGDMLLKEEVEISPSDDSLSLSEKLSRLGAEMIARAIPMIEGGNLQLIPQGEGFICKKVARTQVDFSKSAKEVSCIIRGLAPSPLSYATINGITLNFYMAEEMSYDGDEPVGTVICDNPKQGLCVKCGKNAVKITFLQPAGGKKMAARDFLNGRKVQKGDCFDQPLL